MKRKTWIEFAGSMRAQTTSKDVFHANDEYMDYQEKMIKELEAEIEKLKYNHMIEE